MVPIGRRPVSLARPAWPWTPGVRAVEEWETQAGGFLAVGVGSGITGNPVDLLVIDDPIKSRQVAASEAYRGRVKDWYADDLSTR